MNGLRLGWLRLTGCAGCQLSLLNAEEQLAQAASALELISFPLVTSHTDDQGPLDVALVEGALSTPEELEALMKLRRRATTLVAVGACALSGGIPALASDRRGERFTEVYGPDTPCASFPPQAVRRFVSVDLEIPGCPPEPGELLLAFGSLVRHGAPELDRFPVCFECRQQENLCLLFETTPRRPCLGPLTRAGCGARCPAQGIPCEGCRGQVPEARRAQLVDLLTAHGFSPHELADRLGRFGESSP